MDQLLGYLKQLLEGSGAQAAVVWARTGPSATVVCACPAELLPEGTPWPEISHATSAIVHRDPAIVTRLVPTTLRLELPAAPTAAVSLPLAEPDLSLLLVWCSSAVPEELGANLHRLIDQQIAEHARTVQSERRAEEQAHRLQAVVGSLEQGVVSVDRDRARAEVNPAAATLLGLPAGEVAASEFAAAMRNLESRALDQWKPTSMGVALLADSEATINCTLVFDQPPTHLRVSSHAFRQGPISGRAWLFADVSAEADALEAVESAHDLLRATSDAAINPQVLFEAVRDPAGTVVDFRYRSANPAALSYLGLTEAELIGGSALQTLPNLEGSGLLGRYARCLDSGQPVILDDFSYFNEILDDARRYDIRATRAGANLLSLTWSDVTERYFYVRRIAASEQRYRLLAENASDLVTHVRDGRFVWTSPAADDILGAPAAYWAGRQVQEVIASEDSSAFVRRLATLAAGDTVKERVQIVAVDGVFHWIDLHAKPFYDDSGHRDGFTASLRLADDEVAAQQEADEAQRQRARANAIFRRSMESAAVGMCLTTPDGRFTDVNDAMCRYFGYDAQTLKQMTWQELTVPEFLNADIVNVEKLLRGQIDSYRLTKQFVHADGHRIWGDLSVGCQRKPDGDVDWFIAQINDTTNEVTLAQQLQRQNKLIRQQARADERFRRSMDSGAVAMCLVTPEGRFNQVNDAACRFFGLDARALAEMSFEDVTPPEYLDAERNNYKRLLEGQISSYRMVKHYVRPDGQVIWGDITVSPVLDENGRLEEIVGQIIDVTAEVQARQLLEAQNAENRMLAELLQKTNNRFKSELASAAAYLESIMPNGLQGPVAISSRYLPAQELGGDCFDYRWIDDDHLQFYLIDVSGHGLEPALLSVSVHNMLRSGSLSDQALLAPEMVLAELNRLFQMDGQHNHYFTAWYGVYERSTRTLRYANAGAPPAYAFTTAAGSAIRTTELTTKSTPIGLFDGTEFMTVIYSVPPGCRILLYSDGASEIALAGGGQLTLEGFKSLASRFAGSADWSIDRLVDKLRDLATGGVFEDDCSVIQISFD